MTKGTPDILTAKITVELRNGVFTIIPEDLIGVLIKRKKNKRNTLADRLKTSTILAEFLQLLKDNENNPENWN